MSIQEELQALAQRIQALEERPTADQLVPSSYSINSKGELEEKLTGKLEAQGIIMPNGKITGSSPGLGIPGEKVLNEIDWGQASAIEAHSWLAGLPEISSGQVLNMLAKLAGGPTAALSAIAHATPEARAETTTTAGTEKALLLNSAGESSFLQLAGNPNQLAIAVGSTSVHWAGSAESEVKTVAHGLGRAPSIILLTAEIAGEPIDFQYGAAGVETFQIHGWANRLTSGSVICSWIAIG